MAHNKPFLITPLPPVLAKACQLHAETPKQYATIYELAQSKPEEALKKLENLQGPESGNLKAYVLLKMKKAAEAEKAIEANFQNYPDNLSAKINYADLCLRKKRWKEIEAVFPSADLSHLYPDQENFSVSEFRGFMVFMGLYHLKLRKYKLAEQFYVLAVKADPLHPSVVQLEKKIFDFRVTKSIWRFFSSRIRT